MMVLQVLGDDGSPLDAHFELEGDDIVFHAHGGSGDEAINGDYDAGLELLLGRIAASPLSIEGAWVDSSTVQSIPLDERQILAAADLAVGPDNAFSVMKARMPKIGRRTGARGPGNPTKRIRIRLSGDHSPEEIRSVLGGRPIKKDLRSRKRLPVEELQKVTADHVWDAVQKLLDGYSDHGFGSSADFDLITGGGVRLPPKAVFGVAASEALDFKVLPVHFTGGLGTPCFRILQKAGFEIVPKGEASKVDMTSLSREDREWAEGRQKLVLHLRKERGPGLAKDKKADFVRMHGKLFCERCQMDPKVAYGPHGDACIEVHHHKTQVADMDENHRTRLEDLQCLCANCHRIVHREMKAKSV
jgi:5-methylcytosine-specific restriction protein A